MKASVSTANASAGADASSGADAKQPKAAASRKATTLSGPRVTETIRSLILSGELAPGSKIPQ
ncbi:MAG: hypothetical protein WBA56_00705 [Stenotrophomonas sp.]